MLGDVSITRNSSGGLTLAIDVPDETNPGVYTGVVVDTVGATSFTETLTTFLDSVL